MSLASASNMPTVGRQGMSQLSMPHANSTDRDSRFIAQHILLALAVATWIAALINSMVQDLPDWSFRIKVTFLACLSQVPGLLLAYLGPKRHGVRHILLAAAFFVSVTALLAYGMYAASGPADAAAIDRLRTFAFAACRRTIDPTASIKTTRPTQSRHSDRSH
jgi:hypothetical protein